MLEVRLLGQFDLRRGDRRLEIPSRPAQSLFAYLILNVGIQHRRERLAGMLWPESLESSAKNNLRQALWRIRSSIEDDRRHYILSDRFHISFDEKAEYWLDVDELQVELTDDATVEDWMRTVSLFEGDLLPGFYDDWVALERERVRVEYEKKAARPLKKLADAGRFGELLEYGEEQIGLGEASEPAYRAVMLAHFELGDGAKAVATYERCKAALREYGLMPSAETDRLLERIISEPRQAAVDRSTPTVELPGFLREQPDLETAESPETGFAPFVARERELHRLEKLLEITSEGSGQVAFISGEAGTGKTALMREFARRAREEYDSLLVARGNSSAVTGPGDPYLPFREVLGCLVSDLEGSWSRAALSTPEARRAWQALPTSAQALVDRGPDLIGSLVSVAWLASIATGLESMGLGLRRDLERHAQYESLGDASPDRLQVGLFDQCAEVLASIASHRPLLIALDDLQWADRGSLDLLFYLGRRIENLSILLLCAFRPDEVALGRDGAKHPLVKVHGELRHRYGEVDLDLSEVAAGEARLFVNGLIDTEPNDLDDTFRAALFEQTQGHPLFTIELLRDLEARGDLARGPDGAWHQVDTLDWASLPARIESVIEERIGRLDARLIQVANVASVEGDTFTAQAVAEVLNIDERLLLRALSQELDKRHLLTLEYGSHRVDGRRLSIYRFRHRLFQQHLYNRLDLAERAYFHDELGRTLEQLYGEESAEVAVKLARHFGEAGNAAKAVEYLHRAGERARRVSAYAEADGHLSSALKLLGELPAGEGRDQSELKLQVSLGATLSATRGYAAPEVEAAFARARELSQSLGDTPQLFPAIWGLWSFHIVRASHQSANELATQLQHIAGRNRGLALEAARALGSTLLYVGKTLKARQQLEKGLDLYDPQRHLSHAYGFGQNPRVSCLSSLAFVLWYHGLPSSSLERTREAISYAQTIGHPHSLAYTFSFSAVLSCIGREWAEASARSENAIAISEQHGFPLWLAVGKITRGAALSKLGDGSGPQILQDGLDAWQAAGAGLGLPTYLGFLAETQFDHGDQAAALLSVEKALHVARSTQEMVYEPELVRLRGDFLRRESPKEADASLKQAVEMARSVRSNALLLRALVSLCRHRTELGHQHTHRSALRKVYDRFPEGDLTPDLRAAGAVLAE